MKIHQFAQRSIEWMNARAGIPTASEFDNLVTPLFKVRTGDMVTTYLSKKLAERWLGGPLAGFNTFDVEQGNILEEKAIPFYELTYEQKIEQVGLITTDDGMAACSPDGMFADGTGIEIKCPAAETHVRYLIEDALPKDYAAQVHGSMFVTGAQSWKFMSYRRGFPPCLIEVAREEAFQEQLYLAIEAFNISLKRHFDRLCDLNGGPPQHMIEKVKPKSEFVSDPNDIIP